MKYSGIGGQAVIEGIMMRNGDRYAVGVRKPDGEIEVKTDEYISFPKRHKWAGLPFIRGVFAFADSMILGLKSLTFSASFFEDDEDEGEPGKIELWLEKTFGDKLERVLMTFAMAVSFVLALVIFLWLPLTAAGFMRRFIQSETLVAVLEGVLRIAIFIIYIKLISRTEDIRRTFMYHGAEHKCINCVEHGLPLSVDNVALSSKQHKRCGTSFIFIVMIISILFFMVIRVENPLMKFGVRILLIPVIAGVSYEFLSLAGRCDNPVVNILSKPGMWMQNLTTSEPERDMIEVAIAAVEAVFDWQAYEAENFPDGPDALGQALLKSAAAGGTNADRGGKTVCERAESEAKVS
ncbi:MAG: DUF1385 domain-containing protein [Eubacteriales bacterium]|nr:DUF1385 domain-containing protein [Eubacteriales bacterium]